VAYTRGSLDQTAFYGLLSAEKLGLALDPTLTGAESFGDWRTSVRMQADLPQAMLLLLAAGRRDDALRFALQAARTMDRTGIGQLGQLLGEMQEPYIAVLVGKAAAERGIIVPAAYFPLHPLVRRDWPVGDDLALSIARRESEFHPGVASPVGAQGLMQLMPATAAEVSGWLGLDYSRERLLDWRYNAALGTRYLEELQGMLGNSPVLVAAGYNAGPGRPRTWMAERGDFRRGAADVIDWVEMIPFAETRTYVMRVSESIPIYRARLTGMAGPIEFTAILTGEPPRIRPRPRPETPPAAALLAAREAPVVERVSTSTAPAAIAAGVAAEQAAEEAARLPSGAPLRPIARPDDAADGRANPRAEA
jgi:soluble lytic murein transglycosylase